MTFICYDRCTTCQKARKWLDEKRTAYTVRPIREDNPTREEILRWQAMSGLPLRRFVNYSDLSYCVLLKSELPASQIPVIVTSPCFFAQSSFPGISTGLSVRTVPALPV